MIAPVTIRQPKVIEFGIGKRETIGRYVNDGDRVFAVCDPAVFEHISDIRSKMESQTAAVEWLTEVVPEPPLTEVERISAIVERFAPTVIIGIGGGSSIDLAKVLSVLYRSAQSVTEILGIDAVAGRGARLIAIPTTSGTGSEVTPIAVLTDTEAHLKKGVVSGHLVPDVAIVDPELTQSAPASVTAATGIDALTHCIEAYTNVNAHPVVDAYALEGIKLITAAVERAVTSGSDLEARTMMSLGSLYGGMCLGPVNTAAVHALAYPLGGTFKVSHGVANSMLLPWVMAFNAKTRPERYATIAQAMGVPGPGNNPLESARTAAGPENKAAKSEAARGRNAAKSEKPGAANPAAPGEAVTAAAAAAVARVRELSAACRIPSSLADFGVRAEHLDTMAADAMKVTRLLNNNPRPVTESDARELYRLALAGA